jgi:selenide,water dikinase
MSDVYAMGGRVLLALNVAGFPREFPREAIGRIFQGGADKVAEAGAVLAGGHTVTDREPKYGLAVTGVVHPDRVMIKGGLRPGDRLFLTKPLGTGVIATAGKGACAESAHMDAAVESMTRLNRGGAEILAELGIRGCTDVTGFGFLGHGSEMVVASGCGFRIHPEAVPLLPGAMAYAEQGLFAGGLGRNRKFLQGQSDRGVLALRIADAAPKALVELLFDSETSGGLLFSAPPDIARIIPEWFATRGERVWQVGEVIPEVAIEITGR